MLLIEDVELNRREPALSDSHVWCAARLLKLTYEGEDQKERKYWLAKQSVQIRHACDKILDPRNPVTKLGHRVRCALTPGDLCSTHKDLDPRIIHTLRLAVTNEVDVHNEAIRGAIWRGSRWRTVRQEVVEWNRRLQTIATLFDYTNQYCESQRMRTMAPAGFPPHERCEACKLAVVGGSKVMLRDLRASAVARVSILFAGDERPPPEVVDIGPEESLTIRLVNAWSKNWYTPSDQEWIIEDSNRLVRLILSERQTLAILQSPMMRTLIADNTTKSNNEDLGC